jgi:tyrosine-specific transport protein
MINKKFWWATFTLSGTIMGAGILGLPYVFTKSGFLIGVFWLIFLGTIVLFVNLCMGEITLRTKENHQLPGHAKKHLGPFAGKIMLFALVFGIYSALLAYLVGEGESLSRLLPGNINPIFLGIGFWLIMTLILREGLRALKKVETYGVIAIILIILGMFIKFFPRIEPANLLIINEPNFTLPIGVVLFAILGFASIPELRKEIKGEEKYFKKAIILGSIIPIILYIIFSAIFIGVLGNKITEVATLSFGPFIIILGIFTMLTSYIALSFALKDTFKEDLKLNSKINFLLTSIVPLIIYLLISKWGLLSFTKILGIGGVVSGGLTGIIILLTCKKSKKTKRNKNNPEIKMPLNWLLILILSIIFISGIIIELIP